MLSGSYQEYQRIFNSTDASLIWECVSQPLSSVSEKIFIDHCEILQVSQTADTETIERVFRLLAKRYHPDNADTGDPRQFDEARKTYDLLSNPERRAQYDITYDDEKGHQWRIFDQGSAADGREQDRRVFHGVLSLLYVARRRDPESGGLGIVHLERTLGVPREHLEFLIWYLKRRGWIETLNGGQIAITVEGVDKLGSQDLSLPDDHLLAESSFTAPAATPGQRSIADGAAGPTNGDGLSDPTTLVS